MIVYHMQCDRCGDISTRTHYSDARRDAEHHERAYAETVHLCRVAPRNISPPEAQEEHPDMARRMCAACGAKDVERLGPERPCDTESMQAAFRCLVCAVCFLFIRPRHRWT